MYLSSGENFAGWGDSVAAPHAGQATSKVYLRHVGHLRSWNLMR